MQRSEPPPEGRETGSTINQTPEMPPQGLRRSREWWPDVSLLVRRQTKRILKQGGGRRARSHHRDAEKEPEETENTDIRHPLHKCPEPVLRIKKSVDIPSHMSSDSFLL